MKDASTRRRPTTRTVCRGAMLGVLAAAALAGRARADWPPPVGQGPGPFVPAPGPDDGPVVIVPPGPGSWTEAPGAWPAEAPPSYGHPGHGPGACSCHARPGLALVAYADALRAEVDAFLCGFEPTAECVPDGRRILRDALRVREEALELREAVLEGASPHRLDDALEDVEEAGDRLAGRVARIARGRTGPNIERVARIAALCRQIRFAPA